MQRIHHKALTLWRIYGIFNSLFFVIVTIGLYILNQTVQLPFWIFLTALVISVIFIVYMVFVSPYLAYKYFRYEVRDFEVEIQHGVFVIKRVLVPMVKVQHVDTKQGPLQRKFGLATVTVSSAATTHEIPALKEDIADQLRNRISVLARVEDEDV